MRLAFVTPAWRRAGITAICLSQRARLIEELAEDGIEAVSVVIADDENADTAEVLGMEVLRHPNYALGRKFNDGFEHACRELGADFVCPIGSDQWVHRAYFAELGGLTDAIRSGSDYAIVNEGGTLLARLVCDYRGLCGPRVIPRALLEHVGFRPAADGARKGIDTWTLRGIATAPRFGRPGRPRAGRVEDIPIQAYDVPALGALRYVDFKSDVQMNGYEPLRGLYGVREDDDPWATLQAAYPLDLVERMRDHYAGAGYAAQDAGRLPYRHAGGDWYELDDGTRYEGRPAAARAARARGVRDSSLA